MIFCFGVAMNATQFSLEVCSSINSANSESQVASGNNNMNEIQSWQDRLWIEILRRNFHFGYKLDQTVVALHQIL